MPSDGRNVLRQRYLAVSFFWLCASFIEKNFGVFGRVFVAGVDEELDIKLNFFFGSGIENFLRIYLEKI